MFPGALPRTSNQLMLVLRCSSTCLNILLQPILQLGTFTLWHPLSTPRHAGSFFLRTFVLSLLSKGERLTLRFQSSQVPHFLPPLYLKRLPFLPCSVVREPTRFTSTSYKIFMTFIH